MREEWRGHGDAAVIIWRWVRNGSLGWNGGRHAVERGELLGAVSRGALLLLRRRPGVFVARSEAVDFTTGISRRRCRDTVLGRWVNWERIVAWWCRYSHAGRHGRQSMCRWTGEILQRLGGQFNCEVIRGRRYRVRRGVGRDGYLLVLQVKRHVVTITAGRRVCSQALVHALDLGKADARVQYLLLDFGSGQVSSCVGADICQSVPLVHAKLANSNLDVETAVDVLADIALGKNISQHLLVNILHSKR